MSESTTGNREAPMDIAAALLYAGRHRFALIGFPLLCAAIAAIFSLLLRPTFTATAYFLPPQAPPGLATSQLAAMGTAPSGLSGLAAFIGIKNPTDVYIGILGSRTISDGLIQRFQLKEQYDETTLVDTRKALERVTRISAGKEGLVSIEVDDQNPKRAADLANAYVEELDTLLQGLAITEAGQRRLFFEKQFQKVKAELAVAEDALKSMQEKTGIIKLEEQGRLILETVAVLRAQVVTKEAQLIAMRSFASERNPELERTRQELAALRGQLHKMETEGGGTEAKVFLPTDRVPQAGLEYLRRLRNVKYSEALLEAMFRQLEVAKVEEAKSSPLIQVIDRAVAPDKRSRPYRKVIVLTVFLMAFIAATVYVYTLFLWEFAVSPTARSDIKNALLSFVRLRK